MKRSLFILIAVTVLVQSCAKIFYTPDAISLARAEKVIAIVPPKVAIAARKNIDGIALREQQQAESLNFQREMYSWILRRKMQGRIFVGLQDVETTNAILADVGFDGANPMTPTEICNILGVDGIITSNYSLSKPMSDGAAIATALLLDFWGPTNEATVSLSIHDQVADKMIWNYNHKLTSSLGSPVRLVDDLMRQASREMPYFTGIDSYLN